MTSMNLLLIFGGCLAFSAFVVAPPPPGYEVSENFGECQKNSDDLLEPLIECMKREFTDEQVNETSRMYNGTTCVQCKHFCRKQPQLQECLRAGIEIVKDISNKSKYMVPFLGQLIETVMKALCDNQDGMFPAANEEDKHCIRNSWRTCNSHLDFMGQLDVVAFCDSGNPDTDPLTMEYVCRKIADFLDCADDGVKVCSRDVIVTTSTLKNKLRNVESCANYY